MENKLNQTKRSPNELDQYPNAHYNIIQNIDVFFSQDYILEYNIMCICF